MMEGDEFAAYKEPVYLENLQFSKGSEELLKPVANYLNESGLYKWREEEFPLKVPPSIFWGEEFAGKYLIDFNQLFVTPNPNELEALARDAADDSLRKLTPEMLDSIQKEGLLQVPSMAYPGQVHVWKVTSLLQKGQKNVSESFQKGIALSLDALLWHFYRRLFGSNFSVVEGVHQLWISLKRTLSMLIGLPVMVPLYPRADQELQKRRSVFVVENLKTTNRPFIFTDGEQEYDMIVMNEEILNLAMPIIHSLSNALNIDWRKSEVSLRIRITEEIHKEVKNGEDIDFLIEQRVDEERRRRIKEAIMKSASLFNINATLPERLVEYLDATNIIAQIMEDERKKKEKYMNSSREQLKKDHPYKSKMKYWLDEQMNLRLKEYDQRNIQPIYTRLLKGFEANKLPMYAFLMKRHIQFEKDIRPGAEKEIESATKPRKVFTWNYKIWRPENWIIKSRANPDNGEVVYFSETNIVSTSTTRYPFWRLWNFLKFTKLLFNNGLYFIIPVNMIYGPLGIKSLFNLRKFYPARKVDYKTGKLITDENITVNSMISRIAGIWGDVKESRAKFERKPDSGFIGKNFTRFFNVVWNYGLGIFFTLGTLVFQPILTVINVVISLLLIPTSIVWAPLIALLSYLFDILLYDVSLDLGKISITVLLQLIFRVIILGIGQIASSALVSLICPIFALLNATFHSVRTILRKGRDRFFMRFIIRRFGRVPYRNDFLIKRIRGPGLTSRYAFQLKPELATLAFQKKLEDMEVSYWKKYIQKVVQRPMDHLMRTFQAVLRPFAGTFDSSHELPVRVQASITRVNRRLENATNQRLKSEVLKGTIPQNAINTGQLRMNEEDLEFTLVKLQELTEEFFRGKLANWLSGNEVVEFWASRNIEEGDFSGLTRSILSEIFGGSFLTPMKESDQDFFLEVKDAANSKEIFKMAFKGRLQDPLSEFTPRFPVKLFAINNFPRVFVDDVAPNRRRAKELFLSDGVRASNIINAFQLFQTQTYFKCNEAYLYAPANGKLGLRINLKGHKSPDFVLKQARLTLVGDDIWGILEASLGSMVMSVFKSTMYPIYLVPTFMDKNQFSQGARVVDANVNFGTGVNSRMKFSSKWLMSKLKMVQEKGDPTFQIVLEYGDSEFGWAGEGVLIRMQTKASKMIDAIENGKDILKL